MTKKATEPCPVKDCTRNKDRSYLMCRPHWSRVSKHLRDAVYAALDSWYNGGIPLSDLRAVQQEAIEEASRP